MMKKFEFPYTSSNSTEEEKQISHQDATGRSEEVGPTKYSSFKSMEKYGTDLYNFEPRKDDIWLVGYPRSGTTLLQETLYLLANDLNFEKAAERVLDERFPFLEEIIMRNDLEVAWSQNKQESSSTAEEEKWIPAHVKLANTKGRRFIKSHFGFDFINPKVLEIGCKVIFIARNIKDCLLSLHNFPVNEEKKGSDAENIYKIFQLHRSNLDPMINYFDILKAAWRRRNNKNLLFLYYEEVVLDKRAAIVKIADFLGKKLSENQLDDLYNHVQVENFQKNKSLNNDHLVDNGVYVKTEKYSFIGRGKVGRWRDIFPEEMNDEMDKWINSKLNEIPDFEMPDCWKEAMDLEY